MIVSANPRALLARTITLLELRLNDEVFSSQTPEKHWKDLKGDAARLKRMIFSDFSPYFKQDYKNLLKAASEEELPVFASFTTNSDQTFTIAAIANERCSKTIEGVTQDYGAEHALVYLAHMRLIAILSKARIMLDRSPLACRKSRSELILYKEGKYCFRYDVTVS